MTIDILLFLITAAAQWHAKKQHAQQAEAAHRVAEHLRVAYQAAAEQPIDVLHQRGRRLAPSLQRHYSAVVRQALPDLAEQILAEPGWPALASTLTETQTAGHAPAALLTKAAARREMDTAERSSNVLV